MAAEILDHGTAEPSLIEVAGKVDFAFWATVACWTPDEATMLSLGLDPEIRDSTVVAESAPFDSLSYRRRKLLILRAIEAEQMPSPLTPQAFIAWAKQCGIEIPDSLRLAVVIGHRNRDQVAVDDNCNTKEAASMLKMIFAMARGGYGWNPTDLRSPTVQAVVDDLHDAGISLSPNTVRKWLTEANDRYGSQSVDEARRA